MSFNFIQTFYCDPEAVGNSPVVSLTSIELFFKVVPSKINNLSGVNGPGVIVSVCEVLSDSPDISKIIPNSIARVEYDRIYAFSDASVGTAFAFKTPITIKTGAFYGIVVQFDDPGFSLWTNKQGETYLGTNIISPGSTNIKEGKLYEGTNSNVFRAIPDEDLKYKVNVARYTANTANVYFVNKPYEFFTVSSQVGTFLGGEWVIANTAVATGNIAVSQGNTIIIGNGTDFTTIPELSFVVFQNGSNNQVVQVASVTNATHMYVNTSPAFSNTQAKFKFSPLGKVVYSNRIENKLYLVDSTANSSLKFTTSHLLTGEISKATANVASIDFLKVNQFVTNFSAEISSDYVANIDFSFASSNGSAYLLSDTALANTSLNSLTDVARYAGVVLSRSTEVSENNLYNNKSGLLRILFDIDQPTTAIFNAPIINVKEADLMTRKFEIDNDYMSGSTDTEVKTNGLAESKSISQKVKFANNRFAEDIRVFMTGYRPQGTEIRLYARIHNSADAETFDDKDWSPLKIIANADRYSSTEDLDDLVEYTYGLPPYPEAANTLAGSFTTQLANNIIVAAGVTPNTSIAAGDVIRLYSPLFANNYMIASVTDANTTTITLGQTIANNNVVGDGYKVDKLKYPHTAFNNILNSNISKYYNSSMNEYETFDSFQVKIVFASNTIYTIPRVDQIQVIGVSA